MSRVIDYAIAVGIDESTATAHGKRGSDHRLVVVEAIVAGDRYRVGLWNVRRDRNRHRVPELVSRVVRLFDLDVLVLCEAQDYDAGLRRVCRRDGLDIEQRHDLPGMAHQAIIAKHPKALRSTWNKRMTRAGWRTALTGRMTTRKFLLTSRYRGLRVAVGHRPPSCRWRRGVIVGPPRRVLATIQHARGEVDFLTRRPIPTLLLEDFNATPDARGRWSPHWVASRVGGKIVAPGRGTHR